MPSSECASDWTLSVWSPAGVRGGAAQRGSVYSEEGKRHRMKTTLFDHGRRQAEYQVDTRTTVKMSAQLSVAAFVLTLSSRK